MAYSITRADMASITDAEWAFSTDRFLPQWDDIPEEFRRGNLYTQLAENLFYGRPLPECEITFLPGFTDDAVPKAANKCVLAHLRSFSPKYQHKIAGVGFMISMFSKLELVKAKV